MPDLARRRAASGHPLPPRHCRRHPRHRRPDALPPPASPAGWWSWAIPIRRWATAASNGPMAAWSATSAPVSKPTSTTRIAAFLVAASRPEAARPSPCRGDRPMSAGNDTDAGTITSRKWPRPARRSAQALRSSAAPPTSRRCSTFPSASRWCSAAPACRWPSLLKMDIGTVVELDRQVGEAVEIFVNDRLVARGEIVLVENRLGVTMTEIIKAAVRRDYRECDLLDRRGASKASSAKPPSSPWTAAPRSPMRQPSRSRSRACAPGAAPTCCWSTSWSISPG